jgi:hypothetical protein
MVLGPARISGYTNGSQANAQALGTQHWAIIEPPTDNRNPSSHPVSLPCSTAHLIHHQDLVVHLMAPKTDHPSNSPQRAVQLINLRATKQSHIQNLFLTWQR